MLVNPPSIFDYSNILRGCMSSNWISIQIDDDGSCVVHITLGQSGRLKVALLLSEDTMANVCWGCGGVTLLQNANRLANPRSRAVELNLGNLFPYVFPFEKWNNTSSLHPRLSVVIHFCVRGFRPSAREFFALAIRITFTLIVGEGLHFQTRETSRTTGRRTFFNHNNCLVAV